MSKKDKIHPDLLNHKYNGSSYIKPRRMHPRNMDQQSSESFNRGHVKQGKPTKKKGK